MNKQFMELVLRGLVLLVMKQYNLSPQAGTQDAVIFAGDAAEFCLKNMVD